MYILDSDIFDILVYPSPARERVRAKIKAVGQHSVWFSIITAYEKLGGILPEIRKSLNPRDTMEAPRQMMEFAALNKLLDTLCGSQIVPFTEEDYETYKDIIGVVKKAPLGCRIAASAKRRDWTVVTHNNADFDVIKNRAAVKVEDWSIVPPT